jgi:hypothetical protein
MLAGGSTTSKFDAALAVLPFTANARMANCIELRDKSVKQIFLNLSIENLASEI